MITSRKSELLTKYDHKANGMADIGFTEASRDIYEILDSLPECVRNTMFRTKYDPAKGAVPFNMVYWIVADDARMLLMEVIPIDPSTPPSEPPVESPVDPPIETTADPVVDNVAPPA